MVLRMKNLNILEVHWKIQLLGGDDAEFGSRQNALNHAECIKI